MSSKFVPSESRVESDFCYSYRPTQKRAPSLLSNYSGHSCLKTSPSPAIPVILKAETQTLKAYGAFTPTSSAFPSLKYFADSTLSTSILPSLTGITRRRRKPSQLVWRIDYEPISDSSTHSSSEGSSPVSSIHPLHTPPSIPSISRTTSYSAAPSPATLFSTTLFDEPTPKVSLHKALATLEKKSKFCTRSVRCATCGKAGSDYPRCGKCGEVWCSRPCRINGGNKHVCTRTSIPTV